MEKPAPSPFALAVLASAFLSLLGSCATAGAPGPRLAESVPVQEPSIDREFRGVWIASFMNIDWPPSPGLSEAELREGIGAILDGARDLNLNAVVLQVRPCGDSLYRSAIAPWSSYLAGEQGREPESGFDPLQAWIDGARERGLRLYAWINPFRAGAPSIPSYAPSSPVSAHPEFTLALGDKGYAWLDPGRPEARAYVLDVVKELLAAYDVDGLFIDDYFYPNVQQMGGLPDFPDEESYAAYLGGGGSLGKAQWRRSNTETFVRDLSALVASTRPGLPFGVSPAGIWRPGNPPGISGRDAYAEAYTDTKRWLEGELADVFSPQLYWPIAQVPQSFPLLLRFWLDENSNHRMLWPSLRLGTESVEEASRVRECLSQIMVQRGMNDLHPGFILYGWRQLSDPDSPYRRALIEGPLSGPALPPAFSWLPGKRPVVRSFTVQRRQSSVLIEWDAPGAREMVLIAEGDGGRRESFIFGPGRPDFDFRWPEGESLRVRLSAVGLSGLESRALELECQEYHGEDPEEGPPEASP